MFSVFFRPGLFAQSIFPSTNQVSLCLGDSLEFHVSYAPPITNDSVASILWTSSSSSFNNPSGDTIMYYGTTTGSDSVFLSLVLFNGAVYDDTLIVVTNNFPVITSTPTYTNVCTSDPSFQLSGALPSGGYYTGSAVNSNFFSPQNATPGLNTVYYHYTANGCTTIDSFYVNVNAPLNFNLKAIVGSLILDGNFYNGVETFTACDGVQDSTFYLFFDNPSFNPPYFIDFGDGNTLSGAAYPSTGLPHTYSAGSYNGSITVFDADSCPTTQAFNVFLGSIPAVNLGLPGNTSFCLDPLNPTSFTFNISNVSNNPVGTIYVVEYNDGSPNDTFPHPPPSSFSHTFSSSSCGATSPLGDNFFIVYINAVNPCQESVATVYPILASLAPVADFVVDDTVCLGASETIISTALGGSSAIQTNGVVNCDSTLVTIWSISPSTYTTTSNLGSFSTIGSAIVWNSGDDNIDVTFDSIGVYTITQYVSNAVGSCPKDTITKTVCVLSPPPSPSMVIDTISGDACFPMILQISDTTTENNVCGNSAYQWIVNSPYQPPTNSWSVLSGGINDSTITIQINFPGTYTINLNRINECGVTSTSTSVSAISPPSITSIVDEVFCDSVTLSLNPGISNGGLQLDSSIVISPSTGWTLVSGSFSGIPVVHFSSPGTYSIIQTAINECGSTSQTSNITISGGPSIQINAPDTVCFGELAVLNAYQPNFPQYTYNWTDSNNNLSSDSIWTVNPDMGLNEYYLSIVDQDGCINTDTVFVYKNSEITVSSFNDTICSGSSSTLLPSITGGIPPYTYLWTGPSGLNNYSSPTPEFTGTTTSIFSLQVTDSRGCTANSTHSIFVDDFPIVELGPDIVSCAGDSILLNVPFQQGFDYLWTNTLGDTIKNTNSILVLPLSPVTFYVQVTSLSGCASYDSIFISIAPAPSGFFVLPDSVCNGASITLTDTNQTAPVVRSWFKDGVFVGSSNGVALQLSNPNTTPDQVIITEILQSSINGCLDTISDTVWVRPSIAFSAPTITLCSDADAQITHTTTGGSFSGYQFQWFPSTGLDSTNIAYPTIDGDSALSTYYVSITDDKGCTHLDSIDVIRVDLPLVDAGLDIMLCQSETLVLQAVSPLSQLSYQWYYQSVSNASVLNPGANLTIFPPVAGEYILSATNTEGCVSLDTLMVSFIPPPVATFAIVQDTFCSPALIPLQDSNVSSFNREWYRDGAPLSSAPSFTDSINNTGGTIQQVVYSQVLQDNLTGCLDTISDTVWVRPVPMIQLGSNNWCFGDSTEYSVASNSIWSYVQIITGDGDTIFNLTDRHLYSNPGFYEWSFYGVDQFGCEVFGLDSITIFQEFPANIQFNPLCYADTLCFNNLNIAQLNTPTSALTGNVVLVEWDFDGDGVIDATGASTPISTIDTGLNVIQSMVYNDSNCTTLIVDSIYVIKPPSLNFDVVESTICAGSLPNLNYSSTGRVDSISWTITEVLNGNSTTAASGSDWNSLENFVLPLNYNPITSYLYSVQLFNCCGSVSVIDSIFTIGGPVLDFSLSVDSGCDPLTTTIQLDGLTPTIYDTIFFDYGDGVLDTLVPTLQISNNDTAFIWQQQTHTFSNPSTNDTTFTITALLQTLCGDTTLVDSIVVFPNTVQPFFNASSNIGCAPFTVQFNNQSFGASNYYWVFDYDSVNGSSLGNTSTASDPSYTYQASGTYLVALFADNGCSYDTAYQTIQVQQTLSPSVNAVSGCEGELINMSLTSNGAISHEWYYNGQIIGTGAAVDYIFTASGSIPIEIISASPNGCSDTLQILASIDPRPQVSFSTQNACFNDQPVQFVDATTLSSGTIISSYWEFGDGNTSTQASPTHSYASPGLYTVTRFAESNFGCWDSLSQTIEIYPSPSSAFNYSFSNAICSLPRVVQFQNLSQGSLGSYWDFDHANPGTATSTLSGNPTHSYSQSGTYTIMHVASNSNGCTDTSYQNIYIPEDITPTFQVSPELGCEDLVVNFSSTTLFDSINNAITTWQWDFGDGNFETSSDNTSHIYDTPGLYFVTLEIATINGCNDTSLLIPIQVLERPDADFYYEPVQYFTTSFVNTSNYTPGSQISWDFGDGVISNLPSPSHTFQDSGNYTVTLNVINPNGCEDWDTLDIYIPGQRAFFIPNAFSPNGDGRNDFFRPEGVGFAYYNMKIFDRWGILLYETEDHNQPWDGRHPNGGEIIQDTYLYVIDVFYTDGVIRETYRGTFTLIR